MARHCARGRVEHHTDIHQTGRKQGFHLVIADLQRHHFDPGVQAIELAQQRRQKTRQDHGKTCQANRPAQHRAHAVDGLANGLQRAEHYARLLNHRQPNGGGQGLPAFATEQLHAEGLFHQRQGLARAGLRHADPLGRAGDVAVIGHSDHQPPMHQVHHDSSCPYGCFLKD
jgi:hypothetical protein